MMRLRSPLTLVLLAIAVACGGGGSGMMTDPGPTTVFRKGAVSGDSQAAAVNTTLPVPLTVVVLVDGAPMAGVVVHFTPAVGSGTATPAVDTTGADGTASTQWKLGTGAGLRTLSATATGVAGPAVGFRATALPGPAATLALASGGGQSQEAGQQFTTALIVRVTDAFGNGISGVSVAWQATSGSGSVSAPTSLTLATGQAATAVTAGDTPGPLQVQASVDSLPGSPVSFDLTVTEAASVINVASNFFSPAADTIPAGGLVRWVWLSGTHNVTFEAGPAPFPTSGDLTAPNNYGPLQLTAPGTYSYQCTIHSGMTGTITVQ